jgi:hypothetical protein
MTLAITERMPSDSETQVFERLTSACVVAVLIIDRAEDAVPVAEALISAAAKEAVTIRDVERKKNLGMILLCR